MSTIDQITALLREFGFPVVVALWFMIRLEKRLDRQSELMASLMQAMAIIAKSVEPRENGSRVTGSFPVVSEQEKP